MACTTKERIYRFSLIFRVAYRALYACNVAILSSNLLRARQAKIDKYLVTKTSRFTRIFSP
jgi:hypothetical protein